MTYDAGNSSSTGGHRFRVQGPINVFNDILYVSKTSVGINTITPNTAYKLDVAGDINCTASFRVNGNVLTSFSGAWNDITTKPTTFPSTWATVSGKPALFDGDYNSLDNKLTAGTNITISATNVISAAGGSTSKWGSVGTHIYRNAGRVSIGTQHPLYNLDVADTIFVGKKALESGQAIIYMGTQVHHTAAPKCAIIAQGITSWSRSKLLFCLENTADTMNANTAIASVSNARMAIEANGNVGIGTTTPAGKLHIQGGKLVVSGASTFAQYVQSGAMCIGDITLNYGGGTNWSTNTAGILMDCLDNTEIAVHDSNHRVTGLLTYTGGATATITIGQNMGWGINPNRHKPNHNI